MMKHTDEETLALMALGEQPSDPDHLHLSTCPQCRRELQSLRRVVAAARTTAAEKQNLLVPPAELWTDIANALDIAPQPSTAAADETAGPADDRVAPADTSASQTRPRRAFMLRVRRISRLSVTVAACAALLGAAAGSAVTWWATRPETSTATADGQKLRSLTPASRGYASLTGDRGHRTLAIQVKGLPSTKGYFEVWLMDRSHTKLVSMGVLNADGRATLPVPANVDLSEYSVVDVSVQPFNGKPDHSGRSIVRGPYA
ncbi:anti-sigma factor [Streptomyces sp. NPDC055060]